MAPILAYAALHVKYSSNLLFIARFSPLSDVIFPKYSINCKNITFPIKAGLKRGLMGLQPRPIEKTDPSITTYYEQLSDFFIDQLFYFQVEYELPAFIKSAQSIQFRLGQGWANFSHEGQH